MLLLLLQGPRTMAVSDTVVIGVLTIIASCLTSWLTAKSQAAEWKGACDQKFINIDKNFDGIEVEQTNQWSEIRKATNGLSEVKGELTAMRRGKSAGHS